MINKSKISILCLTALLIVSIFSGCGAKKAAVDSEIDVQSDITVEAVAVGKTDIHSRITFNGKIKPTQEVSISPKSAGKVSTIHFDVGQQVKAGDILFTLEDTDARLQMAQAQASLASAQATLQKTKGGSAEQQISQLQTALANAEIQYNDAKENYDRMKALLESGGVSRQTFEQAQTSYRVAEQQYNAAKTSLDLTVHKINPENVMAAEAGVKQAQVAYEMAKVQVDNTIVRSPIAGVVSSRNIEVGEFASSAAASMTVMDLSTVSVDINVPENVINKIKLEDKVQIRVDGAGMNTVDGTVSSISPAADVKTQSYPVKIALENKDQLLKSGMFAEVDFVVERIENTVAAPLTALIDEQGIKYIYVAEGDTAKKRQIKTGASDGKFIQIIDGVKENELVIVKGQNLLQDGSKITIVK
ncbi:efflux RND transporter periplasmic adaptor subunit [Petroclostridium sp. X23]|uniref:efflux RND transporter periplasmic adaptor subunit n=1 Tax=Petroclostridium sp. X23 TaxID=3045146 RepID=UPI0024AE25D5|nr:efflux RND transporter periplasmic adaptor subunit [Petroclostridium sp. X23]WHH60873.1 efflux RND transporter periplasmic adaptor subunit [Petroclostridium sp. X23]